MRYILHEQGVQRVSAAAWQARTACRCLTGSHGAPRCQLWLRPRGRALQTPAARASPSNRQGRLRYARHQTPHSTGPHQQSHLQPHKKKEKIKNKYPPSTLPSTSGAAPLSSSASRKPVTPKCIKGLVASTRQALCWQTARLDIPRDSPAPASAGVARCGRRGSAAALSRPAQITRGALEPTSAPSLTAPSPPPLPDLPCTASHARARQPQRALLCNPSQ
jgi:hypothetical protein